MPLPRIAAVATATPEHRFTQAQLLAMAGYGDERRRGFFEASDIEGRYLFIDPARFTPDETVDDLVARLAAAPTVALGLTKRCIHRALDGSLSEAMEAESNALELTSRTADFKEGLAAFREGRPPRFEGR